MLELSARLLIDFGCSFLDTLMSRALHELNAEPKNLTLISEAPPDLERLRAYPKLPQRGVGPHADTERYGHYLVQSRLLKLYKDSQNVRRKRNRHMPRLVAFLHYYLLKLMSRKTLLYMLIQRAGTGTIPLLGSLSGTRGTVEHYRFPQHVNCHRWSCEGYPGT